MAVFRVRPFEKKFFEATLENSRRLILDYELVGPLPGVPGCRGEARVCILRIGFGR